MPKCELSALNMQKSVNTSEMPTVQTLSNYAPSYSDNFTYIMLKIQKITFYPHNVLWILCMILAIDWDYFPNQHQAVCHCNGNIFCSLDFKLSPCSECCLFSFGWFPGVWFIYADVSEYSICSIFKGRCEVILGCEGRLIYAGGILGPRKLGPMEIGGGGSECRNRMWRV